VKSLQENKDQELKKHKLKRKNKLQDKIKKLTENNQEKMLINHNHLEVEEEEVEEEEEEEELLK
jgi:hypothetical protein